MRVGLAVVKHQERLGGGWKELGLELLVEVLAVSSRQADELDKLNNLRPTRQRPS